MGLGSRLTSRGFTAVVLLGIALLATSLLAWQAYRSAAAHRSATEAVLRDYAGLAAAELIRRATVEVGYQGHYVLVQALRDSDGDAARLTTAPDAAIRRAATLVRRSFVADLTSRVVTFSTGSDRPVAAWLGERLVPPAGRYPFVLRQGFVAGEYHMFVLTPPRAGRIGGYEVAADALAPFIRTAIDREPLLPKSLGKGGVSNARLAVAVRDPTGRVLYEEGPGLAGALRVRVPFGDVYSGVLDGFTAAVEIDPAASPELVIGGLPASRLPMVLALLGVAAGLFLVAVLQLRRERALEAMRSEFVASVSHELRTPLTQIRMFAETLRLGRVRSEEERRQSLEIIDRESQRLSCLVDNLLQFSRSAHPLRPLELEALEAAPLVAGIVESFRPVATGAGVRIVSRVSSSGRIRVNADGWRQVLLNLLDNAVKYGPPGQEIEVTLDRVDGKVRLTVEDEGPGIPPAERERVFARFHRLERDRASTVAGTGIGLAVVRELVLLHGGRCGVEAGRRGGARVVVEIPEVRG